MEKIEINVFPNVRAFVESLPDVLQDGGYKINKSFARQYKNEIIKFIANIPNLPAHEIAPEFAYHFQRYGDNLKYVFWKRGNTTWYVFFERVGNKILVRHISNNWTEGQYIR